VNDWRPVTPGRLYSRIQALLLTLDNRYGPIEETLLQRLCCDDCGKTCDTTLPEPEVSGWMMRGSPAFGYKDRCPACSAKLHRAPAPPDRI
jgi:hypothetical protein